MQHDYRGFTAEELERYGIRVEGDHVYIPLLGRGGAWYERVRCSGGCHPKYSTPSGAQPHLFNPLGLGPQSEEVWIAEGEFDALCLVVAGTPALGIQGTQSFRKEWRLLFEEAEIVLAFDSDEAGQQAADKLAGLWEPGQVHRFNPSPYNDLNEWFADDRGGFTTAIHAWRYENLDDVHS